MTQRRQQTRHPVEVPAALEVESTELSGQFRNLSLGGAFLAADTRAAELRTGAHGTVTFEIPTHDRPIAVGASVRWTSDEGVGLQFDGLRAGEVWSLNKFFEHLKE